MNLPLTPLRFLERAQNLYGDKQGVICGELRLTYAEFFDRCRRLAAALTALGVQPGERVAFLGYNCHRLLEGYYGVLLARAVLLPINIRLAPAEIGFILKDAGARILFFDPDFIPLLESLRSAGGLDCRCVSLDDIPAPPAWAERRSYDAWLRESAPAVFDYVSVDENSVAELFYTSATTGDPKGVMLSHRAVYLHGLNVIAVQRYTDASVQLHAIPLFHANGWGCAHTVTAVGGTHVLLRRFDPERVCQLIEQERGTCLCLVPTMANALLHCPNLSRYDFRSMEWVHVGGAAASEELIGRLEEALGCDCYAGYGLTEASPVLTIATLKNTLRGRSPQELRRWKAATGRAIVGVELRVVDSQDREVPRDNRSVGEIVARGDGVMDGYWNRPRETAETLRGGWLRTGDVAVWDEHGYVTIVDRKKEIIISGGENISSLEIEKALAAHPAVFECAVIAVPDEKWGETPKALVVRKPGASVSAEELVAFLRERLAHFKVPRSVEFLDSLPKGGTGKILKKVLREKYWAGYAKRVH
ncbi:MAG TPA: long-chain-fatty-acid--CoA ligase [Terriglobia bacterium]|nr:long-chain-fatty-acid--CoA ligase [Terriglobia bacterium]